MNPSTMVLFFAVFLGICWLRGKWPWLANLPGDIKMPLVGGHIVLPLATSIIASVIVAIILATANRKP